MYRKLLLIAIASGFANAWAQETQDLVFEAGHPSLEEWILPAEVPYPADNKPTPERITLGEMLFFEEGLSRDGDMSCASCHNPAKGWSDGLPTAHGFRGMVLGRATPTIINAGYNSIQMWDGREPTLESQAIGPMSASVEMNTDMDAVFSWLRSDPQYVAAFEAAYPGEAIGPETLQKAIASFERTIVSNQTPFDRWLDGDESAMSSDQVAGFKLFVGKANCAVCHSAPNFTDDGFHNLGLSSFTHENPDMGRYAKVPLNIMKGAFKTPTIREIVWTAPYFHDGSAQTLQDVMEHYVKGGEVTTNLSPNFKPVDLSQQEIEQVIDFMRAVSSQDAMITAP